MKDFLQLIRLVSLQDITEITRGEGETPFFSITTPDKKINIFTGDWRVFEVWFSALQFLTGKATVSFVQ